MGMKKALRQSLDVIAPEIVDKTMLRIDVPIESDGSQKVYSYAAIYTGGKWFLTGADRLLSSSYETTVSLLSHIARYPGATVSLVTEMEVIR